MLVNSSRSEGESNAILEAMATGTLPVVARRNDGNATLLAHGRTGLLFATPDEAVAHCKALLLEEGGGGAGAGTLRQRLCAEARAYVDATHGDGAEKEKYAAVLQLAAAQRRLL